MKRFAFVVGFVALVLASVIVAQSQGVGAEQELLKLEQEWNNADLNLDWATIDRILADDYVLIDHDGEVHSKKQCQAYYEPGKGQVLALVTDDMKVRVYGDAAVVTMRAMIKETHEGKETSEVVRITNTWIKKAGRWQCVSTHSSRIAGGQLTPQQIDQIKNEIKATIDSWIAKWPSFDVEGIFQYYSPDFVGFGPYADKFDLPKYRKDVVGLFNSISAYKWTTYRQDFLVVTNDIVIFIMDGKDELFMKSGDKVIYDPAHYTFGLKKVAGHWKFFYHHSSGVEVTQKAEKK